MSKQCVWKIGSAVFLLLLLCTVFSSQIHRMMQMTVWTTKGEVKQENGMEWLFLPRSCIQKEEPILYYLTEEPGIFRKEWKVKEKYIGNYEILEEKIAIPMEYVKAFDGEETEFVYYCVYPLKEGDTVVREH